MPVAAPFAPAAARPIAAPSGAAQPTRSFGALLDARIASAAGAVPRARPEPGGLGSTAVRQLEELDRARVRLDALLSAARSGRTFTAPELLALQGEAYRYAQAFELSAKLVETGAQSVKQALQAQV